MDFFGRKGDKKLLQTFLPYPILFVFPPPLLFFYLFHAAVFGNAAAVFKQLSHPHQRTCEGQLHSVTSRCIWFSSACASLEVWFTGLGSDLSQQSYLHAAHTVLEPWLQDRMLLQRTRDSKIFKILRVNLPVLSAFASVLSAQCDEMFQLLVMWGKGWCLNPSSGSSFLSLCCERGCFPFTSDSLAGCLIAF